MKKVAVTGGFASGKSSICQFLKELGAAVISADEIVHQYLSENTQAAKQIIEAFGQQVCSKEKIDKAKLADYVFNDRARLMQLESILHPLVRKEIENAYSKANKEGKAPFFVAEVPLLFESGMDKDYDLTVAVICNEETRRKRAGAQFPDIEYTRRSARLIPESECVEKADIVIRNEGELEELKHAVEELFKTLT